MKKETTTDVVIPLDRLERNPLITPAAFRHLNDILQHPDAPPWNYEVGDRIRREDLSHVDAMRSAIRARREPGTGAPPAWLLDWVRALQPSVALFQQNLPAGFPLEKDWSHIPTMSRQDLAVRIEDVVPLKSDLSRLITYDTSGVTGHAIQVPHHPRVMAQNHALFEFVLERYGVHPRFDEDTVSCINVGAQLDTVVFATVFAVWNNAAFAKVNLHGHRWDPGRAQRFFAAQSPQILTGDPVGFAEMLKWNIEAHPLAMLSTAVALTPGLKSQLESAYHCPVIDMYATTETGAVAYAAPDGNGMNILPHDIYVEIVDPDGMPVPEGQRGEICISGGRNPYVPLLRYRTGDFARLEWSRVAGTDPTPRLLDLEAREPVAFRAADGTIISPVDIGRLIRKWIFVRHEFVQHRDGSCEITLCPAHGCPIDTDAMADQLRTLFGTSTRITVRLDEHLGESHPGGKVVPFRSEMAGK